MQVRTYTLGRDDPQTLRSVLDENIALSKDETVGNITNALARGALLRKLDRIDPGFRG